MNTSNLQVTIVATSDGWTQAIGQLQNYAETLGLEWVGGWVAVPADPPKIKMNPETEDFDCPHCGKTQGEFLLALDDGSAMLAEWADDHWEAYPDAEEVSWLGAYCAECNGWISPEAEVVLK